MLGFREKSIYTLHYVLAKTFYTKWFKIYTKADSWFQKPHEEFGKLQVSEKSEKLKFDRVLLCKNTFLHLKHYIPKISLTLTFNYLCENSLNYLCHF